MYTFNQITILDNEYVKYWTNNDDIIPPQSESHVEGLIW